MGNNWELVKLGEIAEIISGKNQKEVENPDGKYPIYGSGGVFGYANEYLCPPGTTVIGRKGTINNPIFVNEKFWNVDTAFGIHPFDKVLPKYLFYFCKGFNFKKLDKSTTIPSLAKRDLLQIDFPLIPLPEQRAIVARIEELFSELDHSIANLKSAQSKLEVYRQAVLKKAFEGNYSMVLIGDLFDFAGGGTPSKNQEQFWNGKIPWASVKDIKGDYLNATKDYISEIGLKNSSSTLASKGEVVLITRINPGKAILTNIDVAINQDLKVVKPKNYFNNKYIFYLFKSIENTCLTLSSGTTVKGINLQNLKSIEIPNIGLEKQTQIVQEIESRLSVADKLSETIQTNLEKAEALRQSILKKAFEGKLLSAAEIEACRQEADWEPAERLVERINRIELVVRK